MRRVRRRMSGDGCGAALQATGHAGGVDAGAAAGTPVVRQVEQTFHRVELADPAQVRALAFRARAEPADALRQAAGEVFDAQGIGVTTDLVAGLGTFRADVAGEVVQDAGQVGENAHHGRAGEAAREVAVLAMRRAAFREVKLPVRRGRDRLKLERACRGVDDRQRGLAEAVGLAFVHPAHAGEAVGRQDFHGQAEGFHALADALAMLLRQGGGREGHALGQPTARRLASGVGRSGGGRFLGFGEFLQKSRGHKNNTLVGGRMDSKAGRERRSF